jgi:hypothetical protein
MTLEGPLTVAGAATQQPHPIASVFAVLGAMAAVQLAIMVLVWLAFRRGSGGDDPGGGSGGSDGGSRRRPPKPPPEGPVCWEAFERQFADYVRDADSGVTASRRARTPG